jgi:HK97 family phage major capsid protein
MTLAQMRAALAKAKAARAAIHTEAGDANLTTEQEARFEELQAEVTDLQTKITAREQAVAEARQVLADATAQEERDATQAEEARQADVIEHRRGPGAPELMRRVDPFAGGDVRYAPPAEVRDRALALVGSDTITRGIMDPAQREHLEGLFRRSNDNFNGTYISRLALLTEAPEYRSAWQKILTSSHPVLTAEEGRAIEAVQELRAMSLTTTAGGFGVPVMIDPTIIVTNLGSTNAIMNMATVKQITNDQWKGVAGTATKFLFGDEASAATSGTPTLAQPVVYAEMAKWWTAYSIEIGGDYPDFAAEMSRLITAGWDESLAEQFTTGAGHGSHAPYGIVTALAANTNVLVASTTAGTIGAVDVNNLWKSLPVRYRGQSNSPASSRTAWISSTDVNNAIQELGSTLGAAFTVDLTAEGVVLLKGRRAFDNDYMAASAAGTAAANELIVGDWSNYVVAVRAGMSVETQQIVTDTTTGAPTGQRGLFAWGRVGADSINDLGFRMLQNKTS